MVIGPLTIRRTKTVEAEQAKRAKSKAISNKMVGLMLHDNRRFKAILHRWGLSEGIIEGGGAKRSKPPKGAVASVL